MADFSENEPLIRERHSKMDSNGLMSKDTALSMPYNESSSKTQEHLFQDVCHYNSVPKWLQDNDYILSGYRSPRPSFSACFKTIFRIHNETGNIWSHLLGCLLFIGITGSFLYWPHNLFQWQDKVVFSVFFAGAISCLGMSTIYHTVTCHSESVAKLFQKLDYCGIALLISGSFVPWLYYGFYCNFLPKALYLTMVITLGTAATIVSLLDKFGKPEFRPVRAGVFIGFGLSGVIPALHHLLTFGFVTSVYECSLGWLLLMAVLYITGAMLYALRFPERYIPGKCDICGQSHQIFHILVVVAALVHYHGVYQIAINKLSEDDCFEMTKDDLYDLPSNGEIM